MVQVRSWRNSFTPSLITLKKKEMSYYDISEGHQSKIETKHISVRSVNTSHQMSLQKLVDYGCHITLFQ